MSAPDPFAVLGLDRNATIMQVRAARRVLAFELHPDRGGDVEAMQRLNAAFEACVAHLTNRRPLPQPSRGSRRRQVDHDSPSFTVDALPAETFEALLVALSWIGELVDDDPPYLLECHLTEPEMCWCRLEVVPDAGGSTVSLSVASLGADTWVSAEAVRDTWVANLNRLGWPTP